MANSPLPRARLTRRAVLRRAAGMAAAAMLAPSAARHALGQARFTAYPFTLGVASGNPSPDGFVLWTRLAPEPFAPRGGMAEDRVQLRWEVARDERFADVVKRGVVFTAPELAHSVHVEVNGLEPARWYFYRFMIAQETSPVGRTRTAPAAGAAVDRLRFAFASCQHFEQGYYAAYRHMAAENLDLVAFLGDYIYESSWGQRPVRRHRGGEPMTLADYRARYAQYRSDADLQRMHALAPWIVTWDDHEVDNDYAGAVSEHLDPNFLARRAAAYQAYFEHMPLRMAQLPRGPDLRLYDRFAFGALATFHVLDDRQYRTPQPCPLPGIAGSRVVENCAARMDPAQTLLGAEQEHWLDAGLAEGGARWTIIAQQTLMASLNVKDGNTGEAYWTDGWSGYPLARRRLLDSLAKHRVANPLVVGGDVHANWVCDLKPDGADERAPAVATEVCGTSITSQGLPQASLNAVRARNPHVRFANSEKRGYATVELTPARAQVALRTLDDASKRDANVATLASFVVEDGRPGAQAA
jgi:alkaline phosphatase D